MAKSGQDFKNFRDDTSASLSALATTPPQQLLELPLPLHQEDDHDSSDAVNPYAWNLVKRRLRRHRRFTVSHGSTPPAPPSTPTSSSMHLAASSLSANGHAADYDSDCFNFNLLYILDYAPKYKKKLKEQQRTDSELAELFTCVTITGGADQPRTSTATNGATTSGASSSSSSSKLTLERGISAASRNIRKPDNGTKIFKIHRNPKEFFREPADEEDSVSAPEYDTEEEETRHRRFTRFKPCRRLLIAKRQRRFELQERMDAVVDTFDAAMSFADA